MFDRLLEIKKRYDYLTERLSDPTLPSDPAEFQKVGKENSSLRPIVDNFEIYQKLLHDLEDNKKLIAEESDEEIREMAKSELPILEQKIAELSAIIKIQLLPKDPNDDKNIFLEIRAGTGGEEAALFAADLFRMYTRYAELKGWRVEIASQSETDKNGFKEVIAMISGDSVYSKLKYESGAHRVQRVPETEASGRVHTSAVTVAVLPEADDIDLVIPETDLKIDVMRAGGAGGQHVNKTESAVRITHLPTGLVVLCRDDRSQHKNRAQAMKVLRTRLLDLKQQEQSSSEAAARKTMVGSGDRSEKIRTYNFPQGRVTDHRIGLTLYQLDTVLNGSLDLLIEPLVNHYQTEALKNG